MGKDQYPTGTDVGALLTAAGLPTAGLDLDHAALVGRQEFEGQVGRRMLAAAQTREFFAVTPGGEVLIGDWAHVDSVQQNGEPLVAGQDYRLAPVNAQADPENPRPYEALVLPGRRHYRTSLAWASALQITGLYGFGVLIPEDAWEAMARLGMLSVLDTTQACAAGTQSGIPTSWREAQSSESYGGSGPGSDPIARLRTEAETVICRATSRYTKVTL